LGRVESDAVVIDFAAYQWPSMHSLFKQLYYRSWQFLKRASTVIVLVSVFLSLINLVSRDLLVLLGNGLTWLLSPMGMHPSQWPEAIALLTGVLAKEVVIGSLNNLYAQMDWHVVLNSIGSFSDILYSLKHALLMQHSSSDGSVLTKVARAGLQNNSIAAVLAYLSFILLYLPCVSTLVVISKELNWRWASWGLVWSTLLAYGVSVLIYQFSQGLAGAKIIGLVLVLMGCCSLLLIKWVRSFEVAV